MDDKRVVRSYKVSEKKYKKALRFCKRKKIFLSNSIEDLVESYADGTVPAVAFADWIADNGYKRHEYELGDDGDTTEEWSSINDSHMYLTEELFDEFLKHQTVKK